MDKCSMFDEFRYQKDKFESMYTVIINKAEKKDIVDHLLHKLKIVNTIKDNFKKKYLNDRLYSFLEYINNIPDGVDCTDVYFVGPAVDRVSIPKKFVNVLREYDVPPITIRNGEHFDVDYLVDLFMDMEFRDILKANNNRLKHYKVNSTKRKCLHDEEHKSLDIDEYLSSNVDNKCLICGVSSAIKKIKTDEHIIVPKNITMDEAMDIFAEDEMRQLHVELEEVLQHLDNEKMADRVLIGKDLEKGIQNFMVKTIYATPKKIEKLREVFDKDTLNFRMVEIRRVEKGDIFDTLVKQYKGIVGFSYY